MGSWDRGGVSHQARTDVQLPVFLIRDKLSYRRFRKTDPEQVRKDRPKIKISDTETKPRDRDRDVRQSDKEMQEGRSWDYRQGAGRKSQPNDVSVRDTIA